MNPAAPPIFDGHNDALSLLATRGRTGAADRFLSNPTAGIDVRRARRGGFAGGLFALWVPSASGTGTDFGAMAEARFDVPLPAEVSRPAATAAVMGQIEIFRDLAQAGHIVPCESAAEIEAAFATGSMAAVLHMEGAEAIDTDLGSLDAYHAAGLRSIGPVWSRPNRFGHGVPFRFPATPDTGPGLTHAGVALVKRCNELKIMVDCSHLTEAGFWDVARVSDAPLVATHSNAHALCAASRNLTDRQLRAIAESDGMVGLNFAAAFLRKDGRMLADVPLERLLQHLDHLVERLGEDRVGLGSDYDGAIVPELLTGVEGLPKLRQAMLDHGYGEALIEKLCFRNWLRVLTKTWGG